MYYHNWTSCEFYGRVFDLTEDNGNELTYTCQDCGETYCEEK